MLIVSIVTLTFLLVNMLALFLVNCTLFPSAPSFHIRRELWSISASQSRSGIWLKYLWDSSLGISWRYIQLENLQERHRGFCRVGCYKSVTLWRLQDKTWGQGLEMLVILLYLQEKIGQMPLLHVFGTSFTFWTPFNCCESKLMTTSVLCSLTGAYFWHTIEAQTALIINGMSIFGIRVVCVVLDLWWSPQTHSLVVFSLRQQSPYPVPVHQTGGGVEWDRWAASTNLFTSTAWLIRPVGAQLHPAFGMYPIWLFFFLFFWLGSSLFYAE